MFDKDSYKKLKDARTKDELIEQKSKEEEEAQMDRAAAAAKQAEDAAAAHLVRLSMKKERIRQEEAADNIGRREAQDFGVTYEWYKGEKERLAKKAQWRAGRLAHSARPLTTLSKQLVNEKRSETLVGRFNPNKMGNNEFTAAVAQFKQKLSEANGPAEEAAPVEEAAPAEEAPAKGGENTG